MNFVTKQQLSSKLGVSVRTVFNYHSISMMYVDDFELDYPTDGVEYYTNKGMSLYQCWVINQLIRIGNTYPKKVIPAMIKTGFIKLSKYDFEKNIQDLSNQSTTQSTAIVLAV